MSYKKVTSLGQYGHDVSEDIKDPGLYCIPIPNYTEESEDEYEWINVDIRKVVNPPEARYQLIIGYDENNEPQMWYCNGAQHCFKRIWQDGCMGKEYKKEYDIMEFLIEDCCINETEAAELTIFFLAL